MLVGLIAMMLLLFTTSYKIGLIARTRHVRRTDVQESQTTCSGRHHVSTLPPDDPRIDARRADMLSYLRSLRRRSSPRSAPGALRTTERSHRIRESSLMTLKTLLSAPRRSMCSTFCCHDLSDEVSQRPRGRWCCEPYHVDQRKGALEPRRT